MVSPRAWFELVMEDAVKKNRICLAGSVLDNLQGFGLGQKEQLFEEFGGGPELLAASL
jgi:superfamily I DNA and RNA helicase